VGDEEGGLEPVGRRTRPAFWFAAWFIGLVAVAGLAFAGRAATEPTQASPAPDAAAVAATDGSASAAPGASAGTDGASGPGSRTPGIALARPTVDGAPVTSARLLVNGSYPDPDRPLKVALFNMWGDELAGANLLVRGEFSVVLRLPEPRPIGPAVLQIRRVDAVGRAELLVERPLVIGPLAAAPAQVERPPLGEDGLVGGLVFGTSWPPGD
jgi:hypothetical protein